MNIVKSDLSQDFKTVLLIPLGDLHIVDSLCDIKEIQRRIDFIKSHDNAYTILNGDLINNGIKSSKTDIYSESMPPDKQVEKVVDLFYPIKDKILSIQSGNHEFRSHRETCQDAAKIYATELGLKDIYSQESNLIFIRFGAERRNRKDGGGKTRKVCYSAFAIHGIGGGRQDGSKFNTLSNMQHRIDSDIYIHSHTHRPFCEPDLNVRINPSTSSYTEVKTYLYNTCAFLKYGGYGERAEYKASIINTPILILDGEKKNISHVDFDYACNSII